MTFKLLQTAVNSVLTLLPQLYVVSSFKLCVFFVPLSLYLIVRDLTDKRCTLLLCHLQILKWLHNLNIASCEIVKYYFEMIYSNDCPIQANKSVFIITMNSELGGSVVICCFTYILTLVLIGTLVD